MPKNLCPFATLRLLTPETTSEPRITPRVAVLHTHGFRGSPSAIGNYFDSDTVHVEAHFSVAWDGTIYQFQLVDRQADAQGDGNGFCVSIETEDDGVPSIPWSENQVASIARLLAWLHSEWGIPLQVVTAWNGSGVGWHSKFSQWNKNAHACPGAVRVQQLETSVLPLAKRGAQQQEDDVAYKDWDAASKLMLVNDLCNEMLVRLAQDDKYPAANRLRKAAARADKAASILEEK